VLNNQYGNCLTADDCAARLVATRDLRQRDERLRAAGARRLSVPRL
jgi:hypothetical protein